MKMQQGLASHRGLNKQEGFTLIELMIVVVIIAIISAIAVPSYQDSVRKTNRADGMEALMDAQQRLERCFTTYGTYMDSATTPCPVNFPMNSPKLNYQIQAPTRTAATYTLRAVPQGEQIKDTKCANLEVNHTGKKTASGSTPDKCW